MVTFGPGISIPIDIEDRQNVIIKLIDQMRNRWIYAVVRQQRMSDIDIRRWTDPFSRMDTYRSMKAMQSMVMTSSPLPPSHQTAFFWLTGVPSSFFATLLDEIFRPFKSRFS